MRWKAHFFLKGDKISDQNNPFGLPSNKTPPTILEMKSFENDVINLIENIKFRNAENQFLRWPTTANVTQYLLNTTTYLVKHNSKLTEHNNRSANHNSRFIETHHNIFD